MVGDKIQAVRMFGQHFVAADIQIFFGIEGHFAAVEF